MAAAAATLHLLHLFKPLPFSSSSSSPLLIRPISSIINSQKLFLNPSHLRIFCNSTSSSLTYPDTHSSNLSVEPEQVPEREEREEEPQTPIKVAPPTVTHRAAELPTLTIKEKKELASYAHSLGKKLKIQQVGKSGVTTSQAAAYMENLESNELLKLKIHNNCPGELPDVVKQLEEATGSVAVGQIGRSVILYRPSLTKLMAEEKKKQAQRFPFKKGFRVKPMELTQKSGEAFRPSGRGRRGKSRFELP